MPTNNNNRPLPRTKPIESSDPHNDLRVVWIADGKRILSDKWPNASTDKNKE